MVTDPLKVPAIWRPYHYIGLELAQSYSIALDNREQRVIQKIIMKLEVLQKDLKVGEKLDGEGGFCARGKLITSENRKMKIYYHLV